MTCHCSKKQRKNRRIALFYETLTFIGDRTMQVMNSECEFPSPWTSTIQWLRMKYRATWQGTSCDMTMNFGWCTSTWFRVESRRDDFFPEALKLIGIWIISYLQYLQSSYFPPIQKAQNSRLHALNQATLLLPPYWIWVSTLNRVIKVYHNS